jgi:hypothetical protein
MVLANANIMTRGALELFIDASTTVDGLTLSDYPNLQDCMD